MKTGLTLEQLAAEITRQQSAKEDYVVNTGNLRLESYGPDLTLRVLDSDGADRIEPLEIGDIAHRQIGTHLSIPRRVSPAVSASPPLHGARWRAAWQTTSAIRHLPSVQHRRSASMLLWTMPACLCPICSPQRMRAFWRWRSACCSTIWAGICPAVI